MKTITKIAIITLTIGWFPFMWVCAFGVHQSDDVRIGIFMSGLFICLVGTMISLAGVFGNNSFWLSLKGLDEKVKSYDDAKKAYQLAEKRLITTALELERDKAKYQNTKEDDTIIHLETCVWQKDIKKRTVKTVYEISSERDYGNSRRYKHPETQEEAIDIAIKKTTDCGEYNDYHNSQSEVITKVTTIREIVRIIKPEEKI